MDALQERIGQLARSHRIRHSTRLVVFGHRQDLAVLVQGSKGFVLLAAPRRPRIAAHLARAEDERMDGGAAFHRVGLVGFRGPRVLAMHRRAAVSAKYREADRSAHCTPFVVVCAGSRPIHTRRNLRQFDSVGQRE